MKRLEDLYIPQEEAVCYTTASQADHSPTLADIIPAVLIPRIHRQSRRMQRAAAARASKAGRAVAHPLWDTER